MTHHLELKIQWLESKLAIHGVGKVIPSTPVLSHALEESAEPVIRQKVMTDVLQEADYEGRVRAVLQETRVRLDEDKVGIHAVVSDDLSARAATLRRD